MIVEHCNTCMGTVRETKGLVCQTCGRDYGTGPNPEPPKDWEPQGNGPRAFTKEDAERLHELNDKSFFNLGGVWDER